jgi:hypothetical protein
MEYEIRIEGELGEGRADWLGDVALVKQGEGATLLRCVVEDQAALFGILKRVRDLGLPLISVDRAGNGDDQ